MTLDITDFKQKTKEELHKEIVQAVKETQNIILRPFPDTLLMTKAQFKLLAKSEEMQQMYNSDQMLYYTNDDKGNVINVMEVKVK